MAADRRRPACIVHWREVQEPDDSRYPGSDELLSVASPLGAASGLAAMGIQHELLPPGRRTHSRPRRPARSPARQAVSGSVGKLVQCRYEEASLLRSAVFPVQVEFSCA